MSDVPRSLSEFEQRFGDESACAEYLAKARWPNGFICPACGGGKAWQLKTKPWTYECSGCGRQTSVTAGTIMHHSKLPLTAWFWAAYVMATQPNGLSALQLQRELGLGSYKTAWLLCAKLRRSMAAPGESLLSGLVEVDETEIPARGNKHRGTGGGGSRHGKLLIVGAVEVRDLGTGRIRLSALPDSSTTSRHAFLAANLAPGATAKTDRSAGHRGAPDASHAPPVVDAKTPQLVRPWVHRIFASLQVWEVGVYHGLRHKHLQSYLDEFVFRFNSRRTGHAAFPSLLGFAAAHPPFTYDMLVSRRNEA